MKLFRSLSLPILLLASSAISQPEAPQMVGSFSPQPKGNYEISVYHLSHNGNDCYISVYGYGSTMPSSISCVAGPINPDAKVAGRR